VIAGARTSCALVVAVLLALAGCGAPIDVPPVTAADVATLQRTANLPDRLYRIEPGDTLFIRYPFHPEMDQEVVVEPDGKIMATRVGVIPVAGLTMTELGQLLKDRTADRLRDPEVVVSIRRFADKTVFVGGEVGKPGVIAYRKGLTPLQAVIAAGGFLVTARVDSVILLRNAESEQNFVARKLDLAQTVTDGTREPLVLAPQDVIFVPRTAIANANLWVRQHFTELLPFVRLSPMPMP
jgi:protein involved in polysaccharide export with SLBB domain